MPYAQEVNICDYSMPHTRGTSRMALYSDDDEYLEVMELFENSLGGSGLKVERIEVLSNLSTWNRFNKTVELFKRSKPSSKILRLLHGTPGANVESIFHYNLKLSRMQLTDEQRALRYYCGDGVYFTDRALYALRFAFRSGQSTSRHLLLFDVLVGDIYRLQEGETRLTSLPPGFDTARPADVNIDSYAKLDEAQYYPTHLLVLEDHRPNY